MHKCRSLVNLASVKRANILLQLCAIHYKDFLKFLFTLTILRMQTSINKHIFLNSVFFYIRISAYSYAFFCKF